MGSRFMAASRCGPSQPGRRDLALARWCPSARAGAIPANGPWRCPGHQEGSATTAPRFCGLCVARPGVTNDLPAGWRVPSPGRITIATEEANGPVDRLSGPDAVRYMSVHSWKQPDSHGRSGTSRRPKEQPTRPRTRSLRAVSAGSGRCWVRTNVGEADGFTGSPSQPIGMPADLRILHSSPRESRVLSVASECAWSARGTFWIMSHDVQLSPATPMLPLSPCHPWLRQCTSLKHRPATAVVPAQSADGLVLAPATGTDHKRQARRGTCQASPATLLTAIDL